jgi:hypothetical protein
MALGLGCQLVPFFTQEGLQASLFLFQHLTKVLEALGHLPVTREDLEVDDSEAIRSLIPPIKQLEKKSIRCRDVSLTVV